MEFQKENEDPEFEYSGDEDALPEVHNKLLNAVSHIYKKQRIEKPQRREPTTQISEFNLSNKTSENVERLVDIKDLVEVLNKRATHHEIKKKVRVMQQKSKLLPKPMEKLYADKLRRQIGYENVKKQLSRWEPIVQRNRAAEHLRFPLRPTGKVVIKQSNDFMKTFKEPTELEKEMAAVLQTSEIAIEEKEKEEELFPLSLEEIIERRKMIAYMRARESYKIAKATRQKKIKSKKYHRILKRERIKKELKDFEILQKTNPEAALEKLEKIERARAEERITLRHKNTGKWAKSQAIRAKYDTEARTQLAEQLAKSRELTRKIHSGINSNSEGEDNNEVEDEILQTDPLNPWKSDENQESEVASFLSGFKQFQNEKQIENIQGKKENSVGKLSDGSVKTQNSCLQSNSSSNENNCKILREKTNVNESTGNIKTNERIEVTSECNLVSDARISGNQREDESSMSEEKDDPHDEILLKEEKTIKEAVKQLNNQGTSSPVKLLDTHNMETFDTLVNNETDSTSKVISKEESSDILRNLTKTVENHQSLNIEKKEKEVNNFSAHINLEKQHKPAETEILTQLITGKLSKNDLNLIESNPSYKKNRKILKSSQNLKINQVEKRKSVLNLKEKDSDKNNDDKVSSNLKKINLKRSNKSEKEISEFNKKKIKKSHSNVKTKSGLWIVSTVTLPSKKKIIKKVKEIKGNKFSIDNIFDNAENQLKKTLNNHINQLKSDINYNEEENLKKSKKTKYRTDLSFKSTKKRSDIDSTLIEVADDGISGGNNDVKALMNIYTSINKPEEIPNIDPHKFLPVKPSKLNSSSLDFVEEQTESADEDEDSKKRQLNLEEAFADDDVVEEFRREKEEIIENSKPKEIDLNLPGWGHWAGCNIDSKAKNKLKRKTRRLLVKFPEIPRKDESKDYVIIHEDLPQTLKNHMVHDLPFPFKSVKDYETSIRAPIGNTWVPRSAFMKLINPSVITKMGSIIEPMNQSELLNFEKKQFERKKK